MHHGNCGSRFKDGGIRSSPRAVADGVVVETVTDTDAGMLPLGMTLLGETKQVDCTGAPLQLKDTVWLNPPKGLRFSV